MYICNYVWGVASYVCIYSDWLKPLIVTLNFEHKSIIQIYIPVIVFVTFPLTLTSHQSAILPGRIMQVNVMLYGSIILLGNENTYSAPITEEANGNKNINHMYISTSKYDQYNVLQLWLV